jgi:hypothetical protein
MIDAKPSSAAPREPPPASAAPPEAVSTQAEADLGSEADQIREQARHSWSPDQGENLLSDSAPETE